MTALEGYGRNALAANGISVRWIGWVSVEHNADAAQFFGRTRREAVEKLREARA